MIHSEDSKENIGWSMDARKRITLIKNNIVEKNLLVQSLVLELMIKSRFSW